MNRHMQRLIALVLLVTLAVSGCATGPGQPSGLETFGRGVAALVLAPLMIVTGIAQGLAFLPYTLGTKLTELNRALIEANAIPLDDAYTAAFGVPTTDGSVDPNSGRVTAPTRRITTMLEATEALQRLLVHRGMPPEEARRYVVTSIDTHTRTRGHTLVAVAYRRSGMMPIRVVGKHTGMLATLAPQHPAWREPYEHDAAGQLVDEVVDWVGIESAMFGEDKIVGMLLVLAAESVKAGRRTPDYWRVERRWVAGETGRIIQESRERIRLDGRTT